MWGWGRENTQKRGASQEGRKEQRKEGEAGVGREFSILKDGACQKGTGVNLKGLPVSKAGTISATK